MTPKISMIDNPEESMREMLIEHLVDFNVARTGRPKDYRLLIILLSHPDTGENLGGLWAETFFDHLYVDQLFVAEPLRRSGIGRHLMQLAEEEAIRRGCIGAWLDTFSFQARGFYERLGYTAFGILEDYPPGHSRIFLKKTFGSQA